MRYIFLLTLSLVNCDHSTNSTSPNNVRIEIPVKEDLNDDPSSCPDSMECSEHPPICEPLQLGDLVINEVMINPSESEPDHEYVELVNVSEKEIDLSGVRLTYNDAEKFIFSQGCMAPKSAVVAYSGGSGGDLISWVWSTAPRGVEISSTSYRFVNSRDFNFVLLSADGEMLSQILGETNLIIEGESLTRSPEIVGELSIHSLASPNHLTQSPAYCANGDQFENNCID